MTELGKSAKRMGHKHPRELRHMDPVPPRPTPKAPVKHKEAKPFGFEYQARQLKWKPLPHRGSISDGYTEFQWCRSWGWYTTAQRRDQAMQAWKKQHSAAWLGDYYGDARPITRGSDNGIGEQK